MKLKKIDWTANILLSTGIFGVLYFTQMLHWQEKIRLYLFIALLIVSLQYYVKDSASIKNIKIIAVLFILVAAISIGLCEI